MTVERGADGIPLGGMLVRAASDAWLEVALIPQAWAVWLDAPGPLRWVEVHGTLHQAFDAGVEHFGCDTDGVSAVNLHEFAKRGHADNPERVFVPDNVLEDK